MKAMLNQGVNFESTAVVSDSAVTTLKDLGTLGNKKNGVYFIGNSYPSSYTTKPGVARFNSEVDQYGNVPGIAKSTVSRIETGEGAWEGVHLVAQALAGVKTISSASLVAALNTVGPTQFGGMVPFDLRTPAFPTTGTFSVLGSLRIFNNEMMVSRVVNGQIVPCVKGFIPVSQAFKITNSACQLSAKS